MKIIFVSHGHPDYANDCLTEIGHPQAEAAAERLKDEQVDKIFRRKIWRTGDGSEDRGRFCVLNEIILNTFPQVLSFHRIILKFDELKRRLCGIFLYTFLSNRAAILQILKYFYTLNIS